MIRKKFTPNRTAAIALVVGVVFVVLAVTAVLLLVFGQEESRRTVGKVFALAPVMGLLGLLGIGLGIRAAFHRVCRACTARVEELPDLAYAAADGPELVRAITHADWAAAQALTPVEKRKILPSKATPNTVVVNPEACTGCGKAGWVSAYRAGAEIPDAVQLISGREADGAELSRLVSGPGGR
ncbi:hypothetical protein [Herbiconiux sp. YIM B11900]|uniref:hypothetical protein n=1 Tax=Herbiconiux sp. YIM B11900 TaxID=3404131 RepID=UPI003F83F88B